jgi:hypothetical protein
MITKLTASETVREQPRRKTESGFARNLPHLSQGNELGQDVAMREVADFGLEEALSRFVFRRVFRVVTEQSRRIEKHLIVFDGPIKVGMIVAILAGQIGVDLLVISARGVPECDKAFIKRSISRCELLSAHLLGASARPVHR